MSYTPGPWKAEIGMLKEMQVDGDFEWAGYHMRPEGWGDDTMVGSVWRDTDKGATGLPGNIETSADNARLIASAPELLEVLEEIIDHQYKFGDVPQFIWDKADTIAAKAKGETK
jgi:hypothetical protein